MAEQTDSAESHKAWMLVLDELTDQLARLRDCATDESRLLELPNTQWLPPTGIGELPAELVSRATALVEEMETLRPVLRRRRDETARQLRAVESVPRDAGQTSVYLDSVG